MENFYFFGLVPPGFRGPVLRDQAVDDAVVDDTETFVALHQDQVAVVRLLLRHRDGFLVLGAELDGPVGAGEYPHQVRRDAADDLVDDPVNDR